MRAETIGIISAIVIVICVVIFSLIQYYILEFDTNITPKESYLLVLGIILEIPIAIILAYLVWFLTTRTQRNNKNYVRRKIVNNYLKCYAIAGALYHVPANRRNIVGLANDILRHSDENVSIMKLHSNLLDPIEIQICEDENKIIRSMFNSDKLQNPTDAQLNNMTIFFRNLLSDYITSHKLKNFYEYRFND